MSGAITAVAVGAGAAALGASTAVAIGAGLAAGNMVSTYKGAKKQAKAIEQGNQIAVAQAKEAKAQQEQAFRASNQKAPDVGAIMAQNTNRGGGAASTMLTGAGGVGFDQLSLNKQTLLGA